MNVTAVKALVRQRDGYRCTECGVTNDEYIATCNRSLDVHRLVPGSEYTVDGCVTLCRKCHGPQPRLPKRSFPQDPLVRFPASLYEEMEQIASASNRPTSWEFRVAIEQHINQHLQSDPAAFARTGAHTPRTEPVSS